MLCSPPLPLDIRPCRLAYLATDLSHLYPSIPRRGLKQLALLLRFGVYRAGRSMRAVTETDHRPPLL